jgi:aarF domain-containing kinase
LITHSGYLHIFALIIRAIGVLEGIALVGDPEFAIVDEAYPYIAQVSI